MKLLTLTITFLMLSACATTEKVNKKFEEQNIAIVKNTTFDPIFSLKTKYTTVKKIDGKEVENKSSYQLPAGKHSLTVSCEYFETSSFVLVGERTFEINLIKGHTYKLIPLPAKKKATGEPVCYPRAKDLTKI